MLREKEYQGDSWLNMKSRALKALLCTTIAFALVWPTIKVHATSIKDLNSKQQRMDKEKSELHSKLDAKLLRLINIKQQLRIIWTKSLALIVNLLKLI